MSEIKQLPNTGTQKGQRDFLFLIITVGWLASIVALKMDWLTLEELKVVGVTFDRWWAAAAIFGGIYAAGEIGRKVTNASINR